MVRGCKLHYAASVAAPQVATFSPAILFSALLVACVAASGCPRKPDDPPPREATPPLAEVACVADSGCSGAAELAQAKSAHDAAVAAEPSAVQHGAELYGRMCAVCHGGEGEGYKADQAPALANPAFLASVSDEFLRFAIDVGRQGTTMSAWGGKHGGPLSEGDLQAVVAFLRSLQKEPRLALDESPLRGNVQRGALEFKRTCERCHGDQAAYLHLRNRQLLAYARPGFLRHAIRAGRPGTEMEGYEQSLGRERIEDLVAYLRSLPSTITAEELAGTSDPPPLPLGPVPLHPKGREPKGFRVFPEMTSVDVVAPELAKKRRMALLDARAPSDYVRSHIAGAVSVPFYDPAPYLAELPKDAWLVCYCGCPHAESGTLATKLLEAGFKKVTVLDEGLGDWQSKGHPMQNGPSP